MLLELFWNKSAVPNTTVFSFAGTSAVANLNWLGGKPTTASVTNSSSGSSDFIVQYSLDDVQKVAAASVVWSGVSSAIGSLAQHFSSRSIFPDGVLVTLLTPIAALRLNSSANANTLTLKALEVEAR